MSELNSIYQEKALQKLNHPERNTHLFSAIPSIGWVAWSSIAVVIFSALIWAVFGIVADKIVGYGMLVDPLGTANISPLYGGRITKLNYSVGDVVKEGDIVAVIEQTDLEQTLFEQFSQIQNAQNNEDMDARASSISTSKEKLHENSNVISPFSGTIVSEHYRVGDIVPSKSSIYDLRLNETNREICAVIFVPILDGAKIKPDSLVQIMPGAVSSEEYGALVGRVRSVSPYPVSMDRLMYWSGNKEFSQWILQKCDGAVVEVSVDLISDEAMPSGYLWTTVRGANEKINSGMVCTANAIIKRKSPLARIFGKLSQWLRSD